MTGVAGMPRVAETVTGRYLGHPLRISERTVTVLSPDGRREIGTAYSISGARRIVRGFRGSKR